MIINTSFRSSLFILIASSLAMAVWMWFADGWADDFPYRHVAYGYDSFFNCRGEEIQSFPDILKGMRNHFLYVNGRLANLIAIIVLQLPSWLTALIQGSMYGLTLAGVMRLVRGKSWKEYPLGLVFTIILVWILLPWEDCNASHDFLINYLWSGAVNLWVLIALFSEDMRKKLGWIIMAAIAAPMHESMGVSMDIMICIWFISNRKQLCSNLRNLLLPSVYIVTSIIPFLSPAFSDVIEQAVSDGLYPDNMLLYHIGVRLYPVWIAALLMIAAMFIGRDKKQMLFNLILWSGIITGIIIAVYSHTEGRAYWWMLLLTIVTGLRACNYIFMRKPGKKTVIISALILFAGVLIWQIDLASWQCILTRERDAVMKEMKQGKQLIIQPLHTYNEVPWWLMNIAGNMAESGTIQFCNMASEVYGDDHHLPVVLADSLDVSALRDGKLLQSGFAIPYYVSFRKLDPPLLECNYSFSGTSKAVNPIYSLRHALSKPTEGIIVVNLLCTPLTGTDLGAELPVDTIYFYRPTAVARSFYGHPVKTAAPTDFLAQ